MCCLNVSKLKCVKNFSSIVIMGMIGMNSPNRLCNTCGDILVLNTHNIDRCSRKDREMCTKCNDDLEKYVLKKNLLEWLSTDGNGIRVKPAVRDAVICYLCPFCDAITSYVKPDGTIDEAFNVEKRARISIGGDARKMVCNKDECHKKYCDLRGIAN
jgi:hypothetical protein